MKKSNFEKAINDLDESLTLLGVITFFTVVASILAGVILTVVILAL